MKTRNVVSAVAVAGSLAMLAPAAHAAKIVWNASAWGGPRAVTRGMEYLAAELPKHTNGNFEFKIHYGEEISPAKANIDGLKIQAFEAAMFCSSYAPGKTPVMTALDLPFLPLPTFESTVAVHQAYFDVPEAKKELERWNAVAFMPNALPQYEFMGVGEPPRKLEDWKGRRARALGGLGDAMRKLGAVPTTMPAPELYTALDRGMIDSASFPFTFSFTSFKLDEVSKWYTINMAPGTTGCHILVAKSSLDALPAEYRKILYDLRAGAERVQGAAYKAADDVNLPKYKKMGLIEVRYTPQQLEQFRDIAGKPVWQEWVKTMDAKGYPGQKLLDFVLDKAKEVNKGS